MNISTIFSFIRQMTRQIHRIMKDTQHFEVRSAGYARFNAWEPGSIPLEN